MRSTRAALILATTLLAGGPWPAAAAGPRHPTIAAAMAPRDAGRPQGFAVAILGGSFGETLADGLREDLAADPATTIRTVAHSPFGLADATRFDAEAAVRTLLAGRHVDAAVIMPGADDVRPLPDGSGEALPGTARWRALYGDRVAALAALFAAKGVPLVWVGLPIVADDDLASDYAALNEITHDRVAKAGDVYVDSWDAFADEGGRFAPDGPDTDGHIVRLRGGDGRAFTKAGGAKLASFVAPMLRRLREEASASAIQATNVVLPSEPDIDADINAEIRRELGLPAVGQSVRGTAPSGDKAPAVIVTSPPVAADGQLLAASIAPPMLAGTAASLAQRVLIEGRPVPPKPGRMDDFAWPRR